MARLLFVGAGAADWPQRRLTDVFLTHGHGHHLDPEALSANHPGQ